MKYKKLTGIVLKKQNYREADQIVTVWTKEAGKVRVLGRGLRSNRSKLSFSMQDLSWVDIETAGRRALPSLISAKPVLNFPGLREDLAKSVAAFYATELMLKMTPDEEPNPEAFSQLAEFFKYLDRGDISGQPLFSVVDSFSLRLMRSLGFSIQHAQDSFRFPQSLQDTLNLLMDCEYAGLQALELSEPEVKQAHHAVKGFIEFILERNIKSEQLLSAA